MLCQYGANNIYIDVTDKVSVYFLQENQIVLPAGPKFFNEYFTDPIEGVVKELIIYLSNNQVIIIGENDLNQHNYIIVPVEPLSILDRMIAAAN
jgi:hypothetical protein